MKRVVKIGNVSIGGNNKVAIQSMTNTDTKDLAATIAQIKELEKAGCEIVRVAFYDLECAKLVKVIKSEINIPLVADIHFNHKIAIECIKNGIDKIRINPGNIGSKEKVKEVVECAKEYNVPIRVGVNSGSLPKELYPLYKKDKVQALYQAIKEQVDMLEEFNFHNIVIAAKASSVKETIKIYEYLDNIYDYPFHIGVTEAGTLLKGSIKSSVAMGILLNKNIGDTMRISLTDDPVQEVKVAKEILKSLNMYEGGIEFVSCPTCGRTRINLIKIAKEVEEQLEGINKNIKIAIMGCIVNGPNEAKDADIGIAGGVNEAVLFKKGEIVRKINEEDIVKELIKEIERM